MLNVQFSDSSEELIVAYFAGRQDPEHYPNTGVVTPDDPRWIAYLEALPEPIKAMLPNPEIR